mgnify:CR=1 FL=1
MDISTLIRAIPDYPKKGIMFRDITPLLKSSEGFSAVIQAFMKELEGKEVDAIAGIESRGFIFGAVLAQKMGLGFIPIRKKGKLPYDTVQEEYELEYGTDAVEVHTDALKEGDRVVVVDDLVATGGTVLASVALMKKLNADVVSVLSVIDLPGLGGSQKIKEQANFFRLLDY